MTFNVALITETFDRAKQENGGLRALGLRFYERLFEKYPGVKHLFQTLPEEQHKKLMASVGSIVATVTNPEVMLPYLRAMGIRHIAYKTEETHYGAVSENLIAVLAEHLSKEGEWTEEIEKNWAEALSVISDVMIDAASNPGKYEKELSDSGFQPNGTKSLNSKPWELELV